ncbi:MAG TPA: nuclear transport factor 2 family protein [Solirubrobacterales bacterium]
MHARYETHREIERILYRYCTAIDTADFDSFAGLFAKGQWFMVDRAGSEPVREWLEENVILYDGQTRMKHQLTNLVIDEDEDGEGASFTCYISLWQGLKDFPVQPIFYGRFRGTFARVDGEWWWKSLDVTSDLVGDMSHHIKDWGAVEGSTAAS